MYSFYEYLAFFVIYAFLGWCAEVIFNAVNTGHFVNRGFLNGPVCPIYGFGSWTALPSNIFMWKKNTAAADMAPSCWNE